MRPRRRSLQEVQAATRGSIVQRDVDRTTCGDRLRGRLSLSPLVPPAEPGARLFDAPSRVLTQRRDCRFEPDSSDVPATRVIVTQPATRLRSILTSGKHPSTPEGAWGRIFGFLSFRRARTT